MKTIKFRAYNKEDKKMYALEGITDNHFMVDNHWHTRDQFEDPQQYTGLKDKNGIEIYEGDIIKYIRFNWYCPDHPKHNTDLISFCEIFWDEEEHAFRERGRYESGGGWEGYLRFNDDRADICKIQVIGNIYENPELLEKKS
ncbi:MAG: hypothetical protein JSU85_04960 [Candidatus Zixiibacteriota bacterium]|nr:MAG: hypothetical protein JSU85_04960 [candidate division Zixibacteria bacterium]